jgi:hypothetical protein
MLIKLARRVGVLTPNKTPGIRLMRFNRWQIFKEKSKLNEFIIGTSSHRDAKAAKEISRLPESTVRDLRIFSKGKQVRKNISFDFSLDNIFPKTDSISTSRGASSNSSVNDMKPPNILPPKRPFFPIQMGHNSIIISVPNEGDPLNVLPFIKFVKLLKKKSIILSSKVNNSQPTFILGSSNNIPCS